MAEVKANYVTDFTVKPELMILGLINTANNLALTENDVVFRGPTAIVSPVAANIIVDGKAVSITRDTSLDIDVLSDEVVDDFVTFKYARVDLGVLFSKCNPSFLETTVPVGDNGLPVDMPGFIAELKRKFGVQFTEKDFDYAKVDATHISITAKATNLAYKGTFNIAYMPVLDKRVGTVLLDGFEHQVPGPQSVKDQPASGK